MSTTKDVLVEKSVCAQMEDETSVFRRQSRIAHSPTHTILRTSGDLSSKTQGATPKATATLQLQREENLDEEETVITTTKEKSRGPVSTQPLTWRERELESTPTTSLILSSINQTESQHSSPNQEFIAKMRTEESTAISNIKKSLVKIKAALKRQRNISMDVRDGIQQIEELVCIAETCRVNWLNIENRKKPMQIQNSAVNPQESMETPISNNTKRTASSPAETLNTTKRPRERETVGWQTVENKKKSLRREKQMENKAQHTQQKPRNNDKTRINKRSKPTQKKSEAIIAKPREGYSYADVLRTLRNQAGNEANSKVKTIRKTKTGSLLVEMEKGEQINPELFSRVKEILKESADIENATPKITIEVRDLDIFTTPEEVEESIRSTAQTDSEPMDIRITKPNSRELVRAFVTVSQRIAEELLTTGYIKIGWCRVRLRKYENVKRCFRCFGTGHQQWNCTGPDRRSQGICIRCGEAGHIMKACKNEPKCCICTEAGHSQTNHLAGSIRCPKTLRGPR